MASKKKRYLKVLLSLLAVLFILVLVFFAKINTVIEVYTRTKLSSLIEKDPNSIYEIKYDSLIIDIYSGDVEVIDFSVSPRNQIIDSMRKHKIPRKFRYWRFNLSLYKFDKNNI